MSLLLAPAWSAEISLGTYSATPGSSVLTAIFFAAQGAKVSAIQFDLEYDTSLMNVVFLTADTARQTQKRIYISSLGSNKKRVILAGLNGNVLPDGILVYPLVNVTAEAPLGVLAWKVSQLICSDPDGQPVNSTSIDGSITLQTVSTGATPIVPDGVLNAASLRTGTIAPGEIITLIGSAIGPDGAAVLFDGITAPLLYTSSNQINAIVPFGVSGTTTDLLISASGQKLAELTMPVGGASPAIFTQDGSGAGPAAILNQDSTLNTPLNPASRGSVVSIYATGGGRMDPPEVDGKITDATTLGSPLLPVTAQIGGVSAAVLYAGAAPGLISGMLQVNVRIPDSVPPALAVPISIQVGSAASPAGVTIAVQ